MSATTHTYTVLTSTEARGAFAVPVEVEGVDPVEAAQERMARLDMSSLGASNHHDMDVLVVGPDPTMPQIGNQAYTFRATFHELPHVRWHKLTPVYPPAMPRATRKAA